MRPKILLVLTALLLAVAVYYLLFEERARRKASEAERAMRRMLPYDPRDVERLSLINPHGDTIVALRRGDDWLLAGPVHDIGDGKAIDLFLSLIVPGQILTRFENVDNLADYGLEPPFAALIIESRLHGRSDTIHVGDKTPTSSRAYLRLGESRSVIVARELTQSAVSKTPYHLRDKHFLPGNASEITSLTVITPDTRFEFARTGSEWLICGSALRADPALIEPYLTQLASALIYEFAAEDLADSAAFGIGAPRRELLLHKNSSETIRVSFGRGEIDPGRKMDFVPALRTGRDKIMMLRTVLLDPFDWIRYGVIVMNLTSAQTDQVAAVRWETPYSSVSFDLVGDRWHATGARSTPVDDKALADLLTSLQTTRFESLCHDPLEIDAILDSDNALRIELLGRTGETLDTIRIARLPDGREFASSLTAGGAGRLYVGSLPEIERTFDLVFR